jgi:hypothetical protein
MGERIFIGPKIRKLTSFNWKWKHRWENISGYDHNYSRIIHGRKIRATCRGILNPTKPGDVILDPIYIGEWPNNFEVIYEFSEEHV